VRLVPRATRAKMACPPSSHDTGASVMKNCELLVSGPVFAMLRVPQCRACVSLWLRGMCEARVRAASPLRPAPRLQLWAAPAAESVCQPPLLCACACVRVCACACVRMCVRMCVRTLPAWHT
jgi:hypothetical protein